jgi:hypothetical protein
MVAAITANMSASTHSRVFDFFFFGFLLSAVLPWFSSSLFFSALCYELPRLILMAMAPHHVFFTSTPKFYPGFH